MKSVILALLFAVSLSAQSITAIPWGAPGDLPVRGDFDGDGAADVAVFRPSSGIWYLRLSGSGQALVTVAWGMVGDVPMPQDYDGDGITDVAIFRPASGVWYIMASGSRPTIVQGFSQATILGTAAAFTVVLGDQPASDGTLAFDSARTIRHCVASAGGNAFNYAVTVGVLAVGGQRLTLFAPEGEVFPPFTRIAVICQ